MNRTQIKDQIVSDKLKSKIKTLEFLDWHNLSKNPNITWNIIKDNFDKPWCWKTLLGNPNITWEIATGKDVPYQDNWLYMSRNPNITWDIIRQNPDKLWNWFYLSAHPNITWDIIESNLDTDTGGDVYPWNWYGISINPNITWDIIKTIPINRGVGEI